MERGEKGCLQGASVGFVLVLCFVCVCVIGVAELHKLQQHTYRTHILLCCTGVSLLADTRCACIQGIHLDLVFEHCGIVLQ